MLAEVILSHTVPMSKNSNPVEIVITNPSEVVEALNSPDLAPPGCPASLGQGATAFLRNGMARFSHGEDHTQRRLAIEEALASLNDFPFEQQSFDRTRSHGGDNHTRIGEIIPTETLASALGVADSDLDEVRTSTGLLAATIGRGEPASKESEQAATRLLERFASHPGGAVANVSLLYQNHDATTALITAIVEGSRTSSPRNSALQRTVRVARSETTLDITRRQETVSNQAFPVPTELVTGTVLSLSLQDLGLEFGAGIHQCPGETMAKAIAAGIVRALGYS